MQILILIHGDSPVLPSTSLVRLKERMVMSVYDGVNRFSDLTLIKLSVCICRELADYRLCKIANKK